MSATVTYDFTDQAHQIEALEQLLLKRTALVDIETDGRKIRFTFTRRGIVTRVECYNAMGLDVAQLRKELIDD